MRGALWEIAIVVKHSVDVPELEVRGAKGAAPCIAHSKKPDIIRRQLSLIFRFKLRKHLTHPAFGEAHGRTPSTVKCEMRFPMRDPSTPPAT